MQVICQQIAHTIWTGQTTTCIQPKIFVRWKCDLATIQIGQLHIGWFSMKQVTLTCQIGWFLHCHKSIFPTRENLNHLGGKTLLFSAGESLEVYRATLGHKVFQNYQLEIFANFSLTTLQLENLSQPYITPFQACHSFRPNSETDVFYHPRFGLIRCIATLQHVSRGYLWYDDLVILFDLILMWISDKERWRDSHRLQIQLGVSPSMVQGNLCLTWGFKLTEDLIAKFTDLVGL